MFLCAVFFFFWRYDVEITNCIIVELIHPEQNVSSPLCISPRKIVKIYTNNINNITQVPYTRGGRVLIGPR